MNEEICCSTKGGKVAKTEWKNDDSDSSFSILYSLTYLNKDKSVVLQVINI